MSPMACENGWLRAQYSHFSSGAAQKRKIDCIILVSLEFEFYISISFSINKAFTYSSPFPVERELK